MKFANTSPLWSSSQDVADQFGQGSGQTTEDQRHARSSSAMLCLPFESLIHVRANLQQPTMPKILSNAITACLEQDCANIGLLFDKSFVRNNCMKHCNVRHKNASP